MTDTDLLVLRLEGPLQSWGLRARWDVRDTGTEPSKSGIMGLLGCALGYSRDDPRLREELEARLSIGVREEQRGTIARDFHTVTGTFSTAQGKAKEKTILSPRDYIHDAAFLVVIGGPSNILQKCRNALEDPRWPIYLGRKSCPPTRPVVEAVTREYSSIQEALTRFPWESPNHRDPPAKNSNRTQKVIPRTLRCVMDDPQGNLVRPDSLTGTPARTYETRRVTEFFVTNPSVSPQDNNEATNSNQDRNEKTGNTMKGVTTKQPEEGA